MDYDEPAMVRQTENASPSGMATSPKVETGIDVRDHTCPAQVIYKKRQQGKDGYPYQNAVVTPTTQKTDYHGDPADKPFACRQLQRYFLYLQYCPYTPLLQTANTTPIPRS